MGLSLERRSTPEHLTLVGGEPEIFHCHHYNTVLQQSIEDGGAAMDVAELLRDGAAIAVFSQLTSTGQGAPAAERLALATDHFRLSGFGVFAPLTLTATGGKATLTNSHYALGFTSRKSPRKTPGCFFAAGYLEGVAAAAFGKPLGSYRAREIACAAVSGKTCTFELDPLPRPRTLRPSVGAGTLPTSMPARKAAATSVNEGKILGALATIPFLGNEEGLIPAFGLYLTRHYANYYNYISYEFERRLTETHKHLASAAREVLVEAGHVCAFNTFGGIMESAEWAGLILPMCQKRTDWVSGIVACVNAFGWGRWTVQEVVDDQRLVMRIDASYESNHYLAAYGKGTEPRCYLCCGGVAGIMNLLYVGDVTTKPVLDLAFYDKLFSGPRSFRATETRCRSKGDDHCEFVAERKTYRSS